mmetsp:Transcript_98325/g.246412  ORF Transcript_98325/g.246412 Transcript_98325/m.246412 type:complete len:894 (-) Transcript_98325:201-2882(-)
MRPHASGRPLTAALEEEADELLIDLGSAPQRAVVSGSCRRVALVPLLVGVALLVASALSGQLRPRNSRGAVLGGGQIPEFQEKNDYNYAEYGVEDTTSGGCGNSPLLNDFSSKRGMELAGWWFNWTDDFTFKPLMYKDFVPPDSYWGFNMNRSGAISLRVKGDGILTLDFGNLLGTPGSKVSVYMNLDKKASAGPSVLSKTIEIPFHNADALTIVQDRAGIIVLNRISFACYTTTTLAPSTSKEETEDETPDEEEDKEGDDEIKKATERWKREHEELQKAASLAEKKQQEHYAAVKLAKAQEEVMKRDEKKEQELEKLKEEEAAEATGEQAEEQDANDRLVKALMDVLGREDKSDTIGAMVDAEKAAKGGGAGLSPEEAALQEAKEQEKLAKELALAAREHNAGAQDEDLKEAEELEKQAKEEEKKSQKEVDTAKHLSKTEEKIKRNESWAKELMKNAKEQAKRTEKELKKAEEEEDKQAHESAEAAKLMKTLLAKHRRKAEEKEREKMKEKEAEAADELRNSMTVVAATTETRTTTQKQPSLYCYALMLPFGYEPNLLAAQKQKQVGIFNCDAFTIFSNSTYMLDTGDPCPIEVELLDFSLAVPYGGKWHTALNTPVFNKIWTKVRDMGIYLEHDWVIKADPDTVWFPERLLLVLKKGIPDGALPASQRRLMANRERRRLQKLPMSDGCKHCQLNGLQHDMCDAHVQWLQENKNMSCDEALQQTSRAPPVDCGCNCTRLEACDLSSDHDWRLDGRYIRGDLVINPQSPAVYINNCRFGLHGPIEVLSSSAVTAYVEGLPRCEFLLAQPWGEDKYLDRCMLALGVTRVNVFGMLSEIACGEEPAPCGGTDVAFHPFKKFEEYFACWAFAHSFGHGPFDEEKGLKVSDDGKGFI